jgi:hypothetical protein
MYRHSTYPTRPYASREALVAASRRRYPMTAADMVGQRFSAHDVREVASVLAHYGYSPMASKRLLREGYGPEEIEHRARTGQLARELGVARIRYPRVRRSR